ncbi:MAG TPA: hypothetical protein VEW92_01725 [Nitrososphaeraceae archaeon]|nr:hypothetical protein [Nitrososphaeraceae archaeon]
MNLLCLLLKNIILFIISCSHHPSQVVLLELETGEETRGWTSEID